MSLFNLPVTHKEKVVSRHPWETTIKDIFSNKIKNVHNSINNPVYPKKKEKLPNRDRVKFTIIGNRVTKEFIYCVNLIKGLHKYRWRNFEAPVIRGVTGVEWPTVLNDLKIQHGGLVYCITSQVAVLYNDKFLGGDKELKELVETKYVYNLCLNYPKESVAQFAGFVKSSGRPCAYLHISINDEHIGSLIFSLYADIVPYTCENFLRLCKTTKGGYSGTPVHRIVKDGWIQCGGYGIKSLEMDCENFIIPHDRRGVLCMANDGRHTDCSTQFFVLLQPAPWMEHKYVAFGQLIDGETTLKKIEGTPTWYESATCNVVIHHSGILNIDCQDIMINRGANAYLHDHIEDLVAIGDIFMELLMEQVFLEIEFRHLQQMEPQVGEGAEEHKKDIRATERFMRRKDEIQKQLEKNILESNRASSGPSKPVSLNENNDFDVEDYNYEPEEYSYQQASVAPCLTPKQEKPFYLPLTDVPYPGEVDSVYDLKKFLKGDYCLESDLANNSIKDRPKSISYRKLSYVSDVYNIPGNSDDEAEELDSDDAKEIKTYLKQHVDRVSFAGGVVKSIAKAQEAMVNIFDLSRKSELVTDEELRKLKLASAELRRRDSKKVSITAPSSWDKQVHKIKRRQTGFAKAEELANIRVFQKRRTSSMDDEEEDQADDAQRKVRIEAEETRRLTGFVRPGTDNDEPKVRIDYEEQTEMRERPTAFVRPAFIPDDDEDDEPKVRISLNTEGPTESQAFFKYRLAEYVRPGQDIDDDDEDNSGKNARPSILARLYEEVKYNEDESPPTLKNYRPLSELQRKNILLTSPNRDNLRGDDSIDKYLRPSMQYSYNKLLNLQHGKKVARKVSSDYVNTIDQIERVGRTEYSIRSVEYARTRPTLSVNEYQQKNQKYQEEQKISSKHTDKTFISTSKAKLKLSSTTTYGLRLPGGGDSPLYPSTDMVSYNFEDAV